MPRLIWFGQIDEECRAEWASLILRVSRVADEHWWVGVDDADDCSVFDSNQEGIHFSSGDEARAAATSVALRQAARTGDTVRSCSQHNLPLQLGEKLVVSIDTFMWIYDFPCVWPDANIIELVASKGRSPFKFQEFPQRSGSRRRSAAGTATTSTSVNRPVLETAPTWFCPQCRQRVYRWCQERATNEASALLSQSIQRMVRLIR